MEVKDLELVNKRVVIQTLYAEIQFLCIGITYVPSLKHAFPVTSNGLVILVTH